MTTWLRVVTALGLPLVLSVGVGWAADQQGSAAVAPCSTCHDDVAAAFAANPHARITSAVAGERVANICESCHGDGAKHAAEGEKTLIKVPSGAAGAKTCMSCHQGKHSFEFASTGFHATAAVSCDSCHSIHGATAARLLREPVGTLCAGCHPAQRGLFNKPYAHHLGRGGLDCTSCHNPHGAAGADSLRKTAAGEPACLSCHAEKQGPFVFTHVEGFAGTCLSCHEPHGSNNAKMLTRSQTSSLCLECHTTFPAGTLGPQPPSFHDLRSPRYQNCTTCHVAVHGSNSSPLLLK